MGLFSCSLPFLPSPLLPLSAAKNPVICLDCDELQMLRENITPVVNFLMIERINETIPEGVIRPQMDSVSYHCGDSGLRSMAVCIIMSLGLSLICTSLLSKLVG